MGGLLGGSNMNSFMVASVKTVALLPVTIPEIELLAWGSSAKSKSISVTSGLVISAI
jgi:hypothetical protein